MKRELTKILIDETYSKSPMKNYPTNKTTIKSFDYSWSSGLLDLNGYGIENITGYRDVSVVIDNFSKIGWTILLKNKNAQSITDAFSQIIKSSKRKPYLLETDGGKEFVNKILTSIETNITLRDILEKQPLGQYLLKELIELYVIYEKS